MSALTSPYRSALPSISAKSRFQREQTAYRRTSKSVTSQKVLLTSPIRALSALTFHPDTGAPTGPSQEGYNDFVLLFNRSNASTTVYYVMVDPKRRGRLLPRICNITFKKVKDICEYRVVTMDNMLYVTGGRHLETGHVINQVLRYDPSNNAWCRLPGMRTARCNHVALVLHNIYVIGGETRNGQLTGSVESYDPEVNQWTQLRSLPLTRVHHAGCVHQGRILISGGVGEGSSPVATNQSMWQYDPTTDFWWQCAGPHQLPGYGRQSHVMVSHKEQLFCLTGLSWGRAEGRVKQSDDPSTTSYENTKITVEGRLTGHWKRDYPHMKHPRHSAATVRIGHNIFVIGGSSTKTNQPVRMVEYYNIRKGRWYEAFMLGHDINLDNVELAVVRVPVTNTMYSHITAVIRPRWTLW